MEAPLAPNIQTGSNRRILLPEVSLFLAVNFRPNSLDFHRFLGPIVSFKKRRAAAS